MTVCPWCSSVVDDDATIVARGDHVYHARCYDRHAHAKHMARTNLLPLIEAPPMNEADKRADENAKHFGAAGADLADRNACAQCNKAIPRTEEFWWDGRPYCNNTCRIAKTDPEAAKRHAAERANLQGSALPLPTGLAKPIQAADDPRHKQHGTFLVRSEVSQALKKIIHNAVCGDPNQTTKPGKCDLAPDQLQALDEICGKISRICCGDPNDPEHWDDGAGYFKLVADRLKGVVR